MPTRSALRRVLLTFFAAAMVATAPARLAAQDAPVTSTKGKLLVAVPEMPDPRFAGTVIFMVDHNRNGAFGLVINRLAARRKLSALTDVEPQSDVDIDLHWGGPVQMEQGTALHSPDYRRDRTVVVDDKVAMTGDPELLGDIAAGRGPKKFMIMFGYSGWSAGQLEGELDRRTWVVVPAEADFVFDPDLRSKWRRAYNMRTTDL